MAVSQGFYRTITDWIYSEQRNEICFRPFQTAGNPYKTKCFLVCAYPDTILNVSNEESSLFAEALLDKELFEHLYGDECDSKETRGIQKFSHWYKTIEESPLVVTYLNCLQTNGLTALKLAKKDSPKDYRKGEKLFEQVLLEFLPQCIIVSGNEALKMLRKQYHEIIIDYHQTITKAKDLEQLGVFAKISLSSGHIVHVFACRHMSQFNEKTMENLKNSVKTLLNPNDN